MTRRSESKTTQLSGPVPPLEGSLPATDPRDTLPHLLRSALVPPFSPLRQTLSETELHFMRAFYAPTVPDLSDTRRSQFQHRANATSSLFENVKHQGLSRSDVRLALERCRYIPFLDEVNAWIRSGGQSHPVKTPEPIEFDIRGRAYAKEAFRPLAHELRIPFHMFERGTIEPLYIPRVGFAIRVRVDGKPWTFLTALANGSMLAETSDNPQELARGLASQNRQLVNILERQAPVHLEKAFKSRPVTNAGSKRVSLFLRGEESSPTNYVYLPPSITETHLVPRVDWEALAQGEKRIFLVSAKSKKHIGTVTIPSGPNPIPAVSWGKEVTASPFKRFKPLGAFLRGASDALPQPVDIEIHRSRKTPGYTQQRVLLGKQMSVPAWYPLRTISVHPGIAPDGARFLGLYPPGVSPATNPPLHAFILEEKRVHLKPIQVASVWPGLQKRSEELRALLKTVASSNSMASRDAWLSIHHLAEAEPLVVSTLLLGKESEFSIHNDKSLERIPGWQSFTSILEAKLLEGQAGSVPFVASILAQAWSTQGQERRWAESGLSDVSFAKPSDPLSHIARLATVAPETLERSLDHLRGSHAEHVRNLVGKDSLQRLLPRLARVAAERPRD